MTFHNDELKFHNPTTMLDFEVKYLHKFQGPLQIQGIPFHNPPKRAELQAIQIYKALAKHMGDDISHS